MSLPGKGPATILETEQRDELPTLPPIHTNNFALLLNHGGSGVVVQFQSCFV